MPKPSLIFGSPEANKILTADKAIEQPKHCPFCAGTKLRNHLFGNKLCETCGAIGPDTAPWSWQTRDKPSQNTIRHIVIRHSPDAQRVNVWPDADWETTKEIGKAAQKGERYTIITLHNQQYVSTRIGVTQTDIADARFWADIT